MNYTTIPCLVSRTSTFLLLLTLALAAPGQQVPSNILQAIEWRLIGPHRGGRVTSVSGVPSQPAVYYIGTPGGGVWKTIDGGSNWKNISQAKLHRKK